jgi:hypothetical protein
MSRTAGPSVMKLVMMPIEPVKVRHKTRFASDDESHPHARRK